MNDSLYNPDSMSKEDIKTLFVARQPLLDEIVKTIKTQPKGAGVQHLLMIAPRGMGKTTMLLMVQFAVEDDKSLAKNWRAVRFPEENYDIADLADLWLKVLDYLDDESLKPKIAEIKNEFRDTENLREASWALVKDWSKANKKRIVLLLDNFDMILDQIGDVTEQARLRDVLMNDGTVMLIGGAASYFKEIQDYGQPLYNFFKTQNLTDLKFPEIEELLRRRAGIDAIPNIEELLEKSKTRIRALEAFTGGNPRLVLMLYRIIVSSDISEVRDGLERLLDAVTPFYKEKTERLPAQQRKIINEIALYGLEKSEGVSPTEIAQRIRMTPNQVSTQLKRLLDNGYVKSLNVRGRSSFYVLSEPLYSIWAQMRFGRNAREKRNWLVQMLKAIFDAQERQKEIEKLSDRVGNLKQDGDDRMARCVLEYLICLLETDKSLVDKNFRLAVESYLELGEQSRVSELMDSPLLLGLPKGLFHELCDLGLLNQNKVGKAVGLRLNEVWKVAYRLFVQAEHDFRDANYAASKVKTEVISNWIAKIGQVLTASPVEISKTWWGFFEFLDAKAKRLAGISSAITGDFDKAQRSLTDALRRVETAVLPETMEQTAKTLQLDIQYCLLLNQIAGSSEPLPTEAFDKYIAAAIEIAPDGGWPLELTSLLVQLKGVLSTDRILTIVNGNDSRKLFGPLISALEYKKTKDLDRLEKLSPEVRIAVEEMIKGLETSENAAREFLKSETKTKRASGKKLALVD